MIYRFFKRLTDIAVSLIAIIVFGPLMLALAALIKLGSPGPVFYRGERAGRAGSTFRILKFRSDGRRRGAQGGLLDGD